MKDMSQGLFVLAFLNLAVGIVFPMQTISRFDSDPKQPMSARAKSIIWALFLTLLAFFDAMILYAVYR